MDVKFEWMEECESKFQMVNRHLTETSVTTTKDEIPRWFYKVQRRDFLSSKSVYFILMYREHLREVLKRGGE